MRRQLQPQSSRSHALNAAHSTLFFYFTVYLSFFHRLPTSNFHSSLHRLLVYTANCRAPLYFIQTWPLQTYCTTSWFYVTLYSRARVFVWWEFVPCCCVCISLLSWNKRINAIHAIFKCFSYNSSLYLIRHRFWLFPVAYKFLPPFNVSSPGRFWAFGTDSHVLRRICLAAADHLG